MHDKKKQIKPSRNEARKLIESRLLFAPEMSDRTIAKSLGVSPTTVGKIRKEMEQAAQIGQVGKVGKSENNGWEKHPYLVAHPEILIGASDREIRALRADGILELMQEKGLKNAVYAQTLKNRLEKNVRKGLSDAMSIQNCRLFVADIAQGLPTVTDKTVDLLLVDPAYGKEYTYLLSHISKIAERVLKDDGNLLVLYGNSHLPEAIQRLSEHMQYHWTLAYLTLTGGSPPLQWLGVATSWKPVLWYRKKSIPYKNGLIYDIIDTGKPLKKADKTHVWEQDTAGMSALVDRFSNPSDTVLDCCCGSGTTGEAAIRLGRKFIGCDIDPESVELSRKRLEALIEGSRESK